jgi:1-acyl-sn-glycerol-3-phosphate acyltransferase
MKLLRRIHTSYGMMVFTVTFMISFVPLLVPIFFPKKFRWVGIVNRWWGKMLCICCFLPYRVECRAPLDKKKQYIFYANHFSFFDIPTLALNPVNAIFVGKNAMEKVPLFGFMYGKLHITVDRDKMKSKYDSIIKSRQALNEGKSLMFYPEGGIYAHHPPKMVRFKDGAFRVAIEKQIPIVPVTIPNNWIILPADEFLLRWGVVKIVFHEPIETKGMDLNNIHHLKEQVYNVIDKELRKYEH